jgi:signal peptidase I
VNGVDYPRPIVDPEPPHRSDAGVLMEDPDDTDQPAGDHRTRTVLEWGGVILGALLVAVLIKTFLLQAFFIPSASMVPTLNVGDRVLVNKLSYRLHDVHRGDLIVFERPPGEGPGVKDLIKRVIGLEGETIQVDDDGTVLIDGAELDEPYIPPDETTLWDEKLTVPEDHVFVMGDNRGESRDSRFFGAIDEDLIVGRAFIRVWPPGDLSLL